MKTVAFNYIDVEGNEQQFFHNEVKDINLTERYVHLEASGWPMLFRRENVKMETLVFYTNKEGN